MKKSKKCAQKKAIGMYEWTAFSCNIISGCIHNCKYCYAKEMAARFKRRSTADWVNEIVYGPKVSEDVKKYKGRVMFPSAHDIHPGNISVVLPYLLKLLMAGNEVLLVTKPHLECIQTICLATEPYKKQILFRFTIGSSSDEILRFWEPNAPTFEERFNSLKFAFGAGFQTSLSIEPMLDNVENIRGLVHQVLPFITDAIWIGKPNFLMKRLKSNNALDAETLHRAQEFDGWYSHANIMALYDTYKTNVKIKWKESIKKIVGLGLSTEKGLDK